MVELNEYEQSLLAGDHGIVRQAAMEQLLQVARFFDAKDFVQVSQVHLMADTEALGIAGVEYLESLGRQPWEQRRVLVPTVTDPRGADFKAYRRIRQDESFIDLERRANEAFEALGILMTNTCINYQTIMPPVLGEHLAFGDTGSTIYANSVLGARSNYEGGPAALAAALTGRVPRYGFHLNERRRGTQRFVMAYRPRDWSEWGAVGGIVGRRMRSYWDVPVVEGVDGAPTSDELKHFGAALASFGSCALFHMVGVTPEAPDVGSVFDGDPPPALTITEEDIRQFYRSYKPSRDKLDVVVFAAPQLSLLELQKLAELLDGARIHKETALIATTSPELKSAADRMGLTDRIERSGAVLLEGVCFYQMHAREIGEANGWRTLMSNSAKLVNILGGYGYEPVLATMEQCIESAVTGRVVQ